MLKLKSLAKNDLKVKIFRNNNFKDFEEILSVNLVPGDSFISLISKK